MSLGKITSKIAEKIVLLSNKKIISYITLEKSS